MAAVIAALAAGQPADAGGGWAQGAVSPIAEGVVLAEYRHGAPISSMALHVPAGAPVRFAPVVAHDRIGGGLETVASMCSRVGAVACVNANFSLCPSCDQPFGGVVRDGVILRTPAPDQDTVSVIKGRFTSQPWAWSAALHATGDGVAGGGPIGIDAVNAGPLPEGIVLHSPAYGDRTPTPAGGYELAVRAPEPLRTGPQQRQRVEIVSAHTGGGTIIPPDGLVLSATGRNADRLRQFVERHGATPIDLVLDSPAGLEQAFAGHPILLRDGVAAPLDQRDGKVVNRHPRTVIGWDDHGAVWIVVVDGRQDHSRGLTLAEATDHMRDLGATHAVNLDGGGSSTMVARCAHSLDLCVRNRPSDGRERSVTIALAVFGTPVAPPAPPAPAEPATVLEDAAEAPVVTTTVPAAPPPSPPTTQPAAVEEPEVVREAVPAPRSEEPSGVVLAGSTPDQRVIAALPAAPASRSGRGVLALLAATLVLTEAVALRRLRPFGRRRHPA